MLFFNGAFRDWTGSWPPIRHDTFVTRSSSVQALTDLMGLGRVFFVNFQFYCPFNCCDLLFGSAALPPSAAVDDPPNRHSIKPRPSVSQPPRVARFGGALWIDADDTTDGRTRVSGEHGLEDIAGSVGATGAYLFLILGETGKRTIESARVNILICRYQHKSLPRGVSSMTTAMDSSPHNVAV